MCNCCTVEDYNIECSKDLVAGNMNMKLVLRCDTLAASYQCFGTEDRGSSFLQNTGDLVPDYTASRPRRQ